MPDAVVPAAVLPDAVMRCQAARRLLRGRAQQLRVLQQPNLPAVGLLSVEVTGLDQKQGSR
jgi:hypothetical protein